MNNVDDRVSVRHAIVGQAISVRGAKGDAQIIAPESLPECDVLVLDCEGAEVDILTQMDICSDVVIVETHGIFDAPAKKIREILVEKGYKVLSKDVAEKRRQRFCEENSIYILVAVSKVE